MDISSDNTSRLLDESTTGDSSDMDRDENLARVEVATLAIIFLVTVIGNSTVLLALWTRRRYTFTILIKSFKDQTKQSLSSTNKT
jgi:hypothetical protein